MDKYLCNNCKGSGKLYQDGREICRCGYCDGTGECNILAVIDDHNILDYTEHISKAVIEELTAVNKFEEFWDELDEDVKQEYVEDIEYRVMDILKNL